MPPDEATELGLGSRQNREGCRGQRKGPRPVPPSTIQAKVQAFVKENGMRVERVTTNDNFGVGTTNYTDSTEQAKLDINTAHTNPQGMQKRSWKV